MLTRDAVVQGRYQVLGALGQSSTGNVYLVEMVGQPERRLALKEMFAPEADTQTWRRFESEASAWVGTRHRSMPSVYDYFHLGQAAYVAMDYVPGRTLWDVLLGQPGAPPVDKATGWLRLMADLLKMVHAKNLVWRELEPANCLVQPDGELKLISFGLGRLFSQPEPNPFSAPEEEFGSMDARSDIYSLGATAYVVLSRHLPPEGWERQTGRAQLPTAPGVSQLVMQIIEQMMAVLPEERYRTLAEAWDALQGALLTPVRTRPAEPEPAPAPTKAPPQLKWKPTLPVKPTAAPAMPVEEEEDEDVDEETELRNYLNDSIREYERYVRNIGQNGLAAPNMLYYRDEIQDTLEALDKMEADTKLFYQYLVDVDGWLREQAQAVVDEIGWNNFKQYWIMNAPPRARWWWYLSRMVPTPPPPPRFWEFWKRRAKPPGS